MPDGATLPLQRLTYAGDVSKMAALGVAQKQKNLVRGGHGKSQQQQHQQQQQQHKQQHSEACINERWVMLNKERFHEIFNETLLHEMTLPEQVPPEVSMPPEVMPLNLVMDARCRDADSRGSREHERCRGEETPPPIKKEKNKRQRLKEKSEKNEKNRDISEVKSRSWPEEGNKPESEAQETQGEERSDPGERGKHRPSLLTDGSVGSADGVFSELLKNRPLVSAALFGKQSAGRASVEPEVIPVAIGKSADAEDDVEEEDIDPVGSTPSTSPQPKLPPAPRVTTPPSPSVPPEPAHPASPSASSSSSSSCTQNSNTAAAARMHSPPQSNPPALSPSAPARCCSEDPSVVAASCSSSSSSRHRRHSRDHRSDNNKNSSPVSECTLRQQPQQQQLSREEYVVHSKVPYSDQNSSDIRGGMKRSMEVHQQQRQNWVSLNKSTLYNLVDELVGSRLGSSGEEEDEGVKDRSPPPRRSISSRQTRTLCNNNKDTSAPSRGSPGNKVMLTTSPLLKRVPVATTTPSSGVCGAVEPAPGNKQVLKQCWVALNKTVVFDMVEQAMAGEKAEATMDLSLPKLNPSSYCDPDCSENYVDSGCTIHKQSSANKSDPRKRVISDEPEAKGSRKRKRVSGRSSGSGCPQRPASAPVDRSSSPCVSPASGKRAPSPHSREYHVLQRAHASQCDKLMFEARKHAAAVTAATASSATSVQPTHGSSPRTQPTAHGTTTESGTRDSPKLGWVAVSKAEVHTIVDSVMSSLLQQEADEGSDKAALVRGSSPPPPVLQQQQTTPHRPWLVTSNSSTSSSSNPKHASTSSHDPCIDSASSSPSSGSLGSSTASSPSHDAQAKATPFKWKSSLLLRVHEQCHNSPPHGDRDSSRISDPDPEEEAVPLDMTSTSSSTPNVSSNSRKTSAPHRKSRPHKSK